VVVEKGRNGVLVREDDGLFVAAELAQLLGDRDRWRRLALNGEQGVAQYRTFQSALDGMSKGDSSPMGNGEVA